MCPSDGATGDRFHLDLPITHLQSISARGNATESVEYHSSHRAVVTNWEVHAKIDEVMDREAS